MKRALLLGTVICSFAPTAVLAQMNYSAFEVSWVDVELDGNPNIDGDGFELVGSYELNDQFYVFGEWQDQSLDFGIDGRTWEMGGGWHTDLSETIDFVATVSYVDAQVDFGNFSADDDGLGLSGGIRARVSEDFELDAGLKFVDFDDSGSDTGFTVGGRFYFNETMAIAAGADFNDNADVIRIGFRAEF